MPTDPHIRDMTGVPLAALAEASGPRGRLLALDLGTRTIGLATGTMEMGLPTPLRTIQRTKFTADADALARLIASERIAGLVLGLPINMDGTEGPRAQSTRSFALNLARFLDARGLLLPLSFVDERLSSVAAEDEMTAAGLSRRRQKQHVDAAAAAEILARALREMRAGS